MATANPHIRPILNKLTAAAPAFPPWRSGDALGRGRPLGRRSRATGGPTSEQAWVARDQAILKGLAADRALTDAGQRQRPAYPWNETRSHCPSRLSGVPDSVITSTIQPPGAP